ncbi:diguanylate cyclase [Candidatus Magnetomorum sp. HK-1]|nr:diguanylate cyclase [Candidatus Magnetomorum sp. HK-1]
MNKDIKTILIIEDNKLNLKLIRTILLISNFKVLEAENAEEGFQILKDHRPDIILMDIQLPGMDGLTATRRIKSSEEYKDIPVIALTAKAMADDEQKALDAGCDGYIIKPIDTRGFISTLTSSINQPALINLKSFQKKLMPKDQEKLGTLEHRIKSIDDIFTHNRKILIVDDDRLNVQLLERQLSHSSYEVICAYCGEDALDIVKEELPDLILMDIMMPGIDGFEVTRAIRSDKKTADIPIILITVLESKEDRIRGLNIGADDFLNKPVMFEELLARVRSLIRLKAYQEQVKGYKSIRQSFFPPDCTIKSDSDADNQNSLVLIQKNETNDDVLEQWIEKSPFDIIRINDIQKAISTIDNNKHIAIVLIDSSVSYQNLHYLCQHIRGLTNLKNTQVVLLTTDTDLNQFIDDDIHCPDDFILKPFKINEINARLTGLFKKKKRLDTLSHRFENSLHSAMTDPLTTLYNKNYFLHFLEKEVRRLKRHKTPLSLMMIDVDNFNILKNQHGSIIGDIILKDTAQLIKNSIREVDMAARFDDKKFTVILPYTDEIGSAFVAERLRSVIDNNIYHYPGNDTNYHITVSIGIITCQNTLTDAQNIVQILDSLMDEAKQKGINQITIKNIE